MATPTPPRAIIWDLDGTLLDSLQDIHLAVNHALEGFGLPLRSRDEVRHDTGNGVRHLMAHSVPGGEAHPHFEALLQAFRAYYVVHCQDHTCPYPGVAQALRRLHAAGIPMAIVSNKLQPGVTELHRRWFADVIDVAIGEQPPMPRKPAPDMVLAAIAQLGFDPQGDLSGIYYVGDSEVDVATARNAGLPCLAVLWGFRSRDVLQDAGASLFVARPDEIG